MKIVKDGNAWHVRADNFINIQESKDHFFIEEGEYQKFKKHWLAEYLEDEIVRIDNEENSAGNNGDYEEAEALADQKNLVQAKLKKVSIERVE